MAAKQAHLDELIGAMKEKGEKVQVANMSSTSHNV